MNTFGKSNPNYRTGMCCRGTRCSLYSSWQGMKQRCLNPRNPKYPRYGGRGIKVCHDWLDIKGFMNWAYANGWEQGLTIDRIDNDGDYCPANCRWVSVHENSRKKRTTKISHETAELIRKRGTTEDWYDLAKEYGCTHGNIWFIMHECTHVPDGECTKKLKQKRGKKCSNERQEL